MSQTCMGGGKKAKKSGADPWNETLITTLEFLSEGNRFSRITLFKTHLNGFSSSGPEGSSPGSSDTQDNGENPRMPDIAGIMHHEGVVLEIESGRGSRRFMQLDFGSSGLEYTLTAAFPWIHDMIPWSEHPFSRFLSHDILPQHSDITVLIGIIQSLRGFRYNLVRFNCQGFARLVLENYIPQEIGCVPALIFDRLYDQEALETMEMLANARVNLSQ